MNGETEKIAEEIEKEQRKTNKQKEDEIKKNDENRKGKTLKTSGNYLSCFRLIVVRFLHSFVALFASTSRTI